MRHPYRTCRRAALELLQDYPHNLTIKAAQFLGQICKKGCVEITEKQEDWLEKLLEKNKLPKLSANVRDREAEPKPAADSKAETDNSETESGAGKGDALDALDLSPEGLDLSPEELDLSPDGLDFSLDGLDGDLDALNVSTVDLGDLDDPKLSL
ncbi:MAG: hypothetical protein AB8B54_10000 [Sphingorhabdus sp.]